MIDLPLLLAFVVAATVLTITPGVDSAMVLRSATVGGVRAGTLAGIGIAVGCFVWGAAVSQGLGAILEVSELAYTIVKWAGAAYLIWIGANMVFNPRKSFAAMSESARSVGLTALRQGFLTNMLNPKIGVFYVTFLPQFVPKGADVTSYSFLLVAIHVALSFVWFAALIAAAVPLGRFLRRPKVVRTMDLLTGGIFVAFGVKLAASSAHH